MPSFIDDIGRFNAKVEQLVPAVFVNLASAVKSSIQFGSVITGSPGQPVADVDGGNLRNSWQLEFESPESALVSTNSAYAPPNEDGIARPGGGPYRLLASVGGRHSVALTIAGVPRLLEDEREKLVGRAA